MQTIKITRQSMDGSKVELDIVALMKVLRNPQYVDYYVAICSVIGPFRTGKSFLLNLLIHHIQSYQVCEISTS